MTPTLDESSPSPVEKQPAEDERRSFVRINDTLNLHYRYLDENSSPPAAALVPDERNRANSELQAINNQLEPLLMRLQDRRGGMARALSLINKKLDFVLAATHRLEKADDGMCAITTPVTLSANGISFYCDEEPPKKNGLIQLAISLESFGVYLDCIGKVARWEPSVVSGRYKIAVIFTQLANHDQEILIQYVVKREMELHRAQSKA
ncbi:MAG: PilZ domain-containing protein [Pseudomonadales bacterium]|nr:PilZ domain-containing protein [Pseudomonadales bacterium]